MINYFKKSGKKLFLIFFGIIFLVLGFNLLLALKADASDEIYCYNPSITRCVSSDESCSSLCSGFTSTCTTGLGADVSEDHLSGAISSCKIPAKGIALAQCQTSKCPVGGATDKDECNVRWLSGTTVISKTGIWDNGKSQCIECAASANLGKVWGDGEKIYTNPSSVFKQLCGADAGCDGKKEGNFCDSPTNSKKCDAIGKCITVPACGKQPGIEVTPSTITSKKNVTKTFAIKITNFDEVGCSSRVFNYWVSSLPSGWTASWAGKKSTASLAPAAYESSSVDITVPDTAADGSYSFVFNVEDKANTSISNTKNVIFLISSSCDSSASGAAFSQFVRDTYVIGDTVKLKGRNCTGGEKNFSLCIYDESGVLKEKFSYDGGSSCFPSILESSKSVSSVGIWKGLSVNGNDTCPGSYSVSGGCPSTTEVYECKKETEIANCPISKKCNEATHKCEVVATFLACDKSSCEGIVGNVPCMCGEATLTEAGKYCCAVDNKTDSFDSSTACKKVFTACDTTSTSCTNGECSEDKKSVCASGAWKLCGTGQTCTAGGCTDGTTTPPPSTSSCSSKGMYTSPLMFGYCTIPELIAAAINWLLGLVSGIIILILIFGGLTYVTSAGDEEKIRSAKNTILYAIIGLVIILTAYAMIQEVKIILKVTP